MQGYPQCVCGGGVEIRCILALYAKNKYTEVLSLILVIAEEGETIFRIVRFIKMK